MEYIVVGLIFAVALYWFILGFSGSLKRTQNKTFSILAFIAWIALAGTLAITISPLFAFVPLVAHIPTLIIGQVFRYTPKGYWGQFADMGALAVLSIGYFAIVWVACGWILLL